MRANDKKQLDLFYFVEDVKKKTGIVVDVFTDQGVSIFDEKNYIDVKLIVSETCFVEKYNKVLFKLSFGDKIYYGGIDGKGDGVIREAILIRALFERTIVRVDDLTVDDFYKAILFGEISVIEAGKYLEKFSISQNPCECFLISVPTGKTEDVKGIVENYIESKDKTVSISQSGIAVIKFLDNVDDEYRSSTEFAEFLAQSIYEELGVSVNIYIGGVVKKVFDLSVSYSQATSTARICKSLSNKGNVHNYKEYILFKMLEDLPKYKLSEYLDSLLDYSSSQLFEDLEMIETAEEFLENSLNVSETSRKLFLHRNTLTYRLDKIEKETGLDVRKFSDAVTFRLITLLKKLLNN